MKDNDENGKKKFIAVFIICLAVLAALIVAAVIIYAYFQPNGSAAVQTLPETAQLRNVSTDFFLSL